MTSVLTTDQPRVLLVSDNRDNVNWGSRSTTMALLETLGRSGLAPRATVMDSEVRRTVPISRFATLDRALTSPPVARLAERALARGERTRAYLRRFVRVSDAVTDDPERSVAWWRERRRPPFERWSALVAGSDAVIINGEGSMIFTPQARREQRFHLAVMELAAQHRVPYMYVNALASDPPGGGRNERTRQVSIRLLRGARRVTARDPESFRYISEMDPAIPVAYVPDAVFTWQDRLDGPEVQQLLAAAEFLKPFDPRPERLGEWRFDRPYLCLGGSSEAAKDPTRARPSYRRLARALAETGLPLYLVASCAGDAFIESIAEELHLPLIPTTTNVWAAGAVLARAAAVVTGRYHPAILAGLGGAPCVMLGADSHKTRSVQDMLGYPETKVFATFPEPQDVVAILRQIDRVVEQRPHWHHAIRSTAIERARQAASIGTVLRDALHHAEV